MTEEMVFCNIGKGLCDIHNYQAVFGCRKNTVTEQVLSKTYNSGEQVDCAGLVASTTWSSNSCKNFLFVLEEVFFCCISIFTCAMVFISSFLLCKMGRENGVKRVSAHHNAKEQSMANLILGDGGASMSKLRLTSEMHTLQVNGESEAQAPRQAV